MWDEHKGKNIYYGSALNKSVGESKRSKYDKKTKDKPKEWSKIKRVILIIGIMTAIYSTNIIIDEITVYDEVTNGIQIVSKHTTRDSDHNIIYETYGIAFDLLGIPNLLETPEEFDINTYGVYLKIADNEVDKIKEMNEIFAYIGKIVSSRENNLGIEPYKSFEDYLKNKGFINKNGEVDLKAYEERLNELVLSKHKIKEEKENVDNFNKR